MSTPVTRAPERPKYAPQGRPMGGGPFGGGRVQEKSLNFVPSLRRLLSQLRPERWVLVGATVRLTAAGGGASCPGGSSGWLS